MSEIRGSDNAPFFLVGSGRSGSTLLRIMLSSHRRITIPPETWYILPLVERLPLTSHLVEPEIRSAVEVMTSHYRWPDMGMDRGTLEARVARLRSPRLRDVLDIVYAYHAEMEGKPRWGDKTPSYVRILPQLSELYPEAKFIHLIRDGRDVVRSFRSTGWHGPRLHASTDEWKEAIRCAVSYRSSALAPRIMEVRYEDLVLHTEPTLRALCTFLAEEFDPAMLRHEPGAIEKVPARERHAHGKLARKPEPSDVFRWRNEMSLREIVIAEAYLSRELLQAGYEPRLRGHFWRPLFLLVRACYAALPVVASFARVVLSPLGSLRKSGR